MAVAQTALDLCLWTPCCRVQHVWPVTWPHFWSLERPETDDPCWKDSWNWSTCSMSKVKSQKAHGLLWDSMGQKLGAWVNTKQLTAKDVHPPKTVAFSSWEPIPISFCWCTKLYIAACWRGVQGATRTKVPALEFAPRWLFVAAVHHSPRYFSDNITKWRKGQNSSGHYWAKNHLRFSALLITEIC